MCIKYYILTITIIIGILATSYFLIDKKTAIEKGRKIEIQTQVSIQDKERTGLQKAVWEAIDKGLNDTKTIEDNHNKDDEKITIYVVSLSDSSLRKLFEKQYGHLDKERR